MDCEIPKGLSFASLSNLECLKLRDFISDEVFQMDIMFMQNALIKELCVGCRFENRGPVLKDITIESSSLELLDFVWNDRHHLDISGEKLRKIIVTCIVYHAEKSSKICAPNLKSFKWIGDLENYPIMGRVKCLEEAEISLRNHRGDFVNLSEVLWSLCSVKVLVLNRETTTVLFNGGCLPALFKNVCYLCIHTEGFQDTLVPAVTSLLGGMSKLHTLIIKFDSFLSEPKDCCGFNMGYWKLQSAAFIDQLKEVTIELSDGSNGIEFARYILAHAQNPNKMTIVYSPEQCNAMSKLKKSKMASSCVTLIEKEEDAKNKKGFLIIIM